MQKSRKHYNIGDLTQIHEDVFPEWERTKLSKIGPLFEKTSALNPPMGLFYGDYLLADCWGSDRGW